MGAAAPDAPPHGNACDKDVHAPFVVLAWNTRGTSFLRFWNFCCWESSDGNSFVLIWWRQPRTTSRITEWKHWVSVGAITLCFVKHQEVFCSRPYQLQKYLQGLHSIKENSGLTISVSTIQALIMRQCLFGQKLYLGVVPMRWHRVFCSISRTQRWKPKLYMYIPIIVQARTRISISCHYGNT